MVVTRGKTILFELRQVKDSWQVHRIVIRRPNSDQTIRTAGCDWPRSASIDRVAAALALIRIRLGTTSSDSPPDSILNGPSETPEGRLAKQLSVLVTDSRQKRSRSLWFEHVFGSPSDMFICRGSDANRTVKLNPDCWTGHEFSFQANGEPIEPNVVLQLLNHGDLLSKRKTWTGLPSAGAEQNSGRTMLRGMVAGLVSRLNQPTEFMLERHDQWHCEKAGLYAKRRMIGRPQPDPGLRTVAPSVATPGGPKDVQFYAQEDILKSLLDESKGERRLIVGGPGIGKSSLLQNVACRLGEHFLAGVGTTPMRAPLIVDLGLWELGQSLKALIDRTLAREGLTKTDEFWSSCDRGDIVFLLDGFDEVRRLPMRQRLADELTVGFSQHSLRGCSAILASRPWAVSEVGLPGFQHQVFQLEHLNHTESVEYIHRYFGVGDPVAAMELTARLLVSPSLARLAQVPLTLAMMCFVSEESGANIPYGEVGLFEAALRQMLRRRELQLAQEFGGDRCLTEFSALRILSHLAWRCWRGETGRRLSEDEAVAAVFDAFSKDSTLGAELGEWAPSALLQALARHSGILCVAAADSYLFREDGYVEYLAARWLSHQPEQVVLRHFGEYAWDASWQVLFAYTAGLLWRGDRSQRTLVKRLIWWLIKEHAAGRDDPWGTLVFSAVRMLGAVDELKNDAERLLCQRTYRLALRSWLTNVRAFEPGGIADLLFGGVANPNATVSALLKHVVGDVWPAIEIVDTRRLKQTCSAQLRAAASVEHLRQATWAMARMSPSHAVHELHTICIQSGESAIRRAAADLLSEIPGDDSVLALANIVCDRQQACEVRAQAAQSLHRLRHTRLPAKLSAALEDSPGSDPPTVALWVERCFLRTLKKGDDGDEFEHTLELLGKLRTPACIAAILAYLANPETEHRQAAIFALGDVGAHAESAAMLLNLASNLRENLRLRLAAVTMLGVSRAESATSFLLSILNEPNLFLEKRKEPDDEDEFSVVYLGRLLFDVDGVVSTFRSAAAESLGRIGSPEAIKALSRVACDVGEDEALRKAAVRALGAARSQQAGSTLLHCFHELAGNARLMEATILAIRACDSSLEESAVQVFAPLLQNSQTSESTRCAIAEILGLTGCNRAVAILADALEDLEKQGLCGDFGPFSHQVTAGFAPQISHLCNSIQKALERIGTVDALRALGRGHYRDRAFRMHLSRGYTFTPRNIFVDRATLRLDDRLCPVDRV